MSLTSICNREVVFIEKDESVQKAAQLMRRFHIGDVVVVENDKNVRAPIPIGIVTDRDIVVEVVAAGVDPAGLTVKDIMSDRIVTVCETDDEYKTMQRMRRAGVRRVPVISKDGALVGILAMDDLLEYVSGELSELAAVASTQRARESRLRE